MGNDSMNRSFLTEEAKTDINKLLGGNNESATIILDIENISYNNNNLPTQIALMHNNKRVSVGEFVNLINSNYNIKLRYITAVGNSFNYRYANIVGVIIPTGNTGNYSVTTDDYAYYNTFHYNYTVESDSSIWEVFIDDGGGMV